LTAEAAEARLLASLAAALVVTRLQLSYGASQQRASTKRRVAKLKSIVLQRYTIGDTHT
jgi:hypothetical protein